MRRSGQQHFERLAKKILEAVRRVIFRPKRALVPVRR
jgi:hypothetical protein